MRGRRPSTRRGGGEAARAPRPERVWCVYMNARLLKPFDLYKCNRYFKNIAVGGTLTRALIKKSRWFLRTTTLMCCLCSSIGAQFMSIFWFNVTDVCLKICISVQNADRPYRAGIVPRALAPPEARVTNTAFTKDEIFNLRLTVWGLFMIFPSNSRK